jgi:hypothetical protein
VRLILSWLNLPGRWDYIPFLLDFLAAGFFALGDFFAAFLAGAFLADFFAAALEAFFAMIRTPFREAGRMPRDFTASLPASTQSKAFLKRFSTEFFKSRVLVSLSVFPH